MVPSPLGRVRRKVRRAASASSRSSSRCSWASSAAGSTTCSTRRPSRLSSRGANRAACSTRCSSACRRTRGSRSSGSSSTARSMTAACAVLTDPSPSAAPTAGNEPSDRARRSRRRPSAGSRRVAWANQAPGSRAPSASATSSAAASDLEQQPVQPAGEGTDLPQGRALVGGGHEDRVHGHGLVQRLLDRGQCREDRVERSRGLHRGSLDRRPPGEWDHRDLPSSSMPARQS